MHAKGLTKVLKGWLRYPLCGTQDCGPLHCKTQTPNISPINGHSATEQEQLERTRTACCSVDSRRAHMHGDLGDEKNNRERFLLELEFVQCLANPGYINCKLPSFSLFVALAL